LLLTPQQTNPLYKMAKTGAAPVARHAEVGSHVTYDNAPSLELDRARLRLGRAIGQGEFGLVYDGLVRSRLCVAKDGSASSRSTPSHFCSYWAVIPRM
jgi:hypothetical protein